MNLKIYIKDINVRVRKFRDDYYLVANGKTYLLNYLGAVVLKYINTDIDIKDLVFKIKSVFSEQSEETIESDIQAFITFLLDEEVIIEDE